MRKFLAGVTLAIILGATPSIALADDGEDTDAPNTADPGITALHTAVKDMQAAKSALRTDCPDRSDTKCRAELRKVHDAFKDAHDKAIAAHHAFKDATKKARDEAKQKAKDALKDRVAARAKPHESAKPSPLTKPTEAPKPSATPRG
jgi:peptidoglycan hydrolase CwlO-like protein